MNDRHLVIVFIRKYKFLAKINNFLQNMNSLRIVAKVEFANFTNFVIFFSSIFVYILL